MSQPPAYAPAATFAEDELNNVGGRSTVSTSALDAELDALETTLAAVLANLLLNQRDDGEIRDGRVKVFTLASDVLALLTSYGSTPRGAWLTATAYSLKDLVSQSGNTYICVTAHTSGTFATDLAAAKWLLFSLGTAPSATLVTFTPTATIAAANVQAAIEESDTEGRALTAAEAAARTAADALIRSDLADGATVGKGTSLIGWLRAATSAVATTLKAWLGFWDINVFEFMSVAQIADVQARTFTLDVTAPVQAWVDACVASRKKGKAPAGGYLLNGGATQPDGYKNGFVVPYTTGLPNADPLLGLVLEGDGGSTEFRLGSNSMVGARVSRNCTTLRDMSFNSNGKTSAILVGIVPEDMTQTGTLVSQSFVNIENVDRIGGAGADGVVIMPGPHVGGSDSGCFYHNIVGGYSNFVGGGRHFYTKKNVDWGANPNMPTRSWFLQQRLTRGNAGYHLEVGSGIVIQSNEELINSGVTPLATPTARYVSADCSNITFIGGYSESCTKSVAAFANNILGVGYIPASGSNTDWRTYANAYGDATDEDVALTITAAGTGGAIGANTSTGRSTKSGKTVDVFIKVAYAKGTVTGPITVNGLPFSVDADWSLCGVAVTEWTGITFPANTTQLGARVAGATIQPIFSFTNGVGTQQLDAADLSANFTMTLVATYKAA